MSTVSKGNVDEQMLTHLLELVGWNVEIARVSKGHFDRVAWGPFPPRKTDYYLYRAIGIGIELLVVRRLIQVKRNGRPEKGFFTEPDPIYLSTQWERVWATRWTAGPRKGLWTIWWHDASGERRETFSLRLATKQLESTSRRT